MKTYSPANENVFTCQRKRIHLPMKTYCFANENVLLQAIRKRPKLFDEYFG